MRIYRLYGCANIGADRQDRQQWSSEVAWSVMAVGHIGTVVTRCREAVDSNQQIVLPSICKSEPSPQFPRGPITRYAWLPVGRQSVQIHNVGYHV